MKFFVCLFLIVMFAVSFEISYSRDINNKKSSDLKSVPNKIMVRLNSLESKTTFLNKIANNSNANIEKALLLKEESVTYNLNLRKKTSSQKNLKIENIIIAEEPLLRTFVLNYNEDTAPEVFAKKLKRNYSEVEIAEPIYIYTIQGELPDDLYAGQQGILHTCDLIAAWDIEQGDTNVVIGISDVGCDQGHEDLKENLARNWADPVNGIDDDGNGYIDDFNGIDLAGENNPLSNTYASDSHGTNVAGIAAATQNNGIGIAGVANKCRFFPIKISRNNELVNAYDSFIYAAKRGLKVLNCSWGIAKPPSNLEQSMINYAVAYDVAIVASAGNLSGSDSKNYPSAYDNVLAVSEVGQADSFTGNNIGEYLDILAPGAGNYYTSNGNRYSNSGSGTSYSAPVVSGILALVRSKYPDLTGLQASELVRQSVNSVAEHPNNFLWKDILPGRVNAYKALITEPFSIPSIRPKKVIFKEKSGEISERVALNDTGLIEIEAFNYLGAYNFITVKMSAVWDDEGSIEVIDSTVYFNRVEQESAITLSGFSFKKTKENYNKMFFRFDISGEFDYKDFFLVEYIPSPILTTFSNKSIAFSASDRGTIGTAGEKDNVMGIGFDYKDKGNQLWESCFLASNLNYGFVSSIDWSRNYGDKNDFDVVKPLVSPNKNIGIFNDSKAMSMSRIGMEVKQEFIVPEGYHTIAKINIEIKSNSLQDIADLSSGYYFDWDVENADSNMVSLVPDAIPAHLRIYPSSVQMVKYTAGDFPVFGCGVISFESGAVAQSAGLNNWEHKIYVDEVALSILRSGTSNQDIGITDVSVFVGMLFQGSFGPDETKKYSICFGGADSEEEFITSMKAALDSTYTPVNEINLFTNDVLVYPNPVSDRFYCEVSSSKATDIHITLIDLLGKELFNENRNLKNPGKILLPFDVSNLSSGNYLMLVKMNNEIISKQINILK
jgi:subtilisin family serine protease